MQIYKLVPLCFLGPLVVQAGPPPPTVDVIVVGAGLSGLSAAQELSKANISVKVLEARDRVGGRVLNRKLKNGASTEAGAEFIGPTQDQVISLAAELDLKLYPTYNEGLSTLWKDSVLTAYNNSGTGASFPIDEQSLGQVGDALTLLDAMAASINTSAPWTHPNASEWDSQTLSSWLDNVVPRKSARFLLDVVTTSVFSAEPRELSLLYAAAYFAAAGNESEVGTLERITGTANGAQAYRVEGGTQLLAIKLAEKLGSEVVTLNAAVDKIDKTTDGYMVTSCAGNFKAKHVVIAMSPPVAARIQYTPLLPASRDQLSQRMFMGSEGKAIAIYPTPFWRKKGLNGQALSDSGVVRTTFDSSPPDNSYGAMMGFIEADQMRDLDSSSEQDIISLVTQDYVNYFGPEAANATEWIIQRWDNEQYSRGGPTALAGPGVLIEFTDSLTKPFQDIHFAGTEASPYWAGYMDGAIRSGKRAAGEILAQI